MAKVVPIESIRRSERAALFEGRDDADVSIFVTQYDCGEGPDLHFHPYPEVFVVEVGTAVFTAGDEEIEVEGGNIVVVPAETRPAPATRCLNIISLAKAKYGADWRTKLEGAEAQACAAEAGPGE